MPLSGSTHTHKLCWTPQHCGGDGRWGIDVQDDPDSFEELMWKMIQTVLRNWCERWSRQFWGIDVKDDPDSFEELMWNMIQTVLRNWYERWSRHFWGTDVKNDLDSFEELMWNMIQTVLRNWYERWSRHFWGTDVKNDLDSFGLVVNAIRLVCYTFGIVRNTFWLGVMPCICG